MGWLALLLDGGEGGDDTDGIVGCGVSSRSSRPVPPFALSEKSAPRPRGVSVMSGFGLPYDGGSASPWLCRALAAMASTRLEAAFFGLYSEDRKPSASWGSGAGLGSNSNSGASAGSNSGSSRCHTGFETGGAGLAGDRTKAAES